MKKDRIEIIVVVVIMLIVIAGSVAGYYLDIAKWKHILG